MFTSPSTPSTPQSVFEVPPESPRRPAQAHSPRPLSPTYQYLAGNAPSSLYESPQQAQHSQRPPSMSSILQHAQANLQTPRTSHHIQPRGTSQMTSTPQQHPQANVQRPPSMSAILQKPPLQTVVTSQYIQPR